MFFMKVLLISANTERLNMPTMPVGLACVATATRKAGHETLFLDLMRQTDPADAIRTRIASFHPDVIGISVRNIDDQSQSNPRFLLEQVKDVVEVCRASSKAPLVLGGAGYSMFPDAVLAYLGADWGVCGDGEKTFVDLLDRLEHGLDPSSLPGVHAAGHRAIPPVYSHNLDDLPLPDRELWESFDPKDPDLWIPVQNRRGCPNACSYCATNQIQGRVIRSRSPRLVVDHIARVAADGFRKFYFVDNSFNIPESQAFELCRLLNDLNPKVIWRCILYPQRVNEDLIRTMAEAGCSEVALGFESGSERILQEMNKRFVPEEVRQTADLLAKYGIRRMGFLLLGGPGETRESVEESLSFAASLDLDLLRVTVGIRIYPGTALHQRAIDDNLMTADDDLLLPRFYLAPGLAPWIHERVSRL